MLSCVCFNVRMYRSESKTTKSSEGRTRLRSKAKNYEKSCNRTSTTKNGRTLCYILTYAGSHHACMCSPSPFLDINDNTFKTLLRKLPAQEFCHYDFLLLSALLILSTNSNMVSVGSTSTRLSLGIMRMLTKSIVIKKQISNTAF